MVYLAAALVLVAFLGWDVARRWLKTRNTLVAGHEQALQNAAKAFVDLEARVTTQAAELAALTARIKTQELALVNALQEMRALLAPVRRAVLQAVPDETRKQRKEG